MNRDRLITIVALIALAVVVLAGTEGLLQRSPVSGVGGPTPVIGAKVSYSKNRLSSALPITFDSVDFDGGGFFDPARPDRLTVAVAGCYFVEAQVTILGWGYGAGGRMTRGNPASPSFSMEVRRNGEKDDYVAADNRTNEDPGVAQLGHTATVECFEVGDYIQLFVTPNRLVESNWPNTDGSLSPVLVMVLVGTRP